MLSRMFKECIEKTKGNLFSAKTRQQLAIKSEKHLEHLHIDILFLFFSPPHLTIESIREKTIQFSRIAQQLENSKRHPCISMMISLLFVKVYDCKKIYARRAKRK
jgi:hypothetical protein